MSTLRQPLKRPETYLATYFVLVALLVADTFRAPQEQLTAWVYVQAVRLYQENGHLILRGRLRCRYTPTCSQYSIGAVELHGIRRGLLLSYERVRSCQLSVPMGTYDPVPHPQR